MEEPNRATPPPLPTVPAGSGVDYFHARPGTLNWVVIATLPTVSQFFTAKNLLDRHRIVNRMDDQDGDTNEVDLMVLASEAEWARDVLSKGIPQLANIMPMSVGFPVVMPGDKSSVDPANVAPPEPQPPPGAMRVLPLESPQMMPVDNGAYLAMKIVLWGILIGVALLTLLFALA
jgi:hypothetical protein